MLPSDGIPRLPNDTWSVRPVWSSWTGVYLAWSAGRYDGSVWVIDGLSGTEPVFLNRLGLPTGMEKLYFCPRSARALVTAFATLVRNATTAGRLCCSRAKPSAE